MTKEEAIRILASSCISGSKQTEALETLIPELNESEDKRMMREFNDWLCEEIECLQNDLRDEEDRKTLNMLCYVLTKVKDWLEKQKEEEGYEAIPVESTLEYKLGFKAGKESEKQKEQKPVDYDAELKKCKDNPLYFYDKYVSIKQKPAEWSEEDEDMIQDIIASIDTNIAASDFHEMEDWLKSLRPSWKPSEDQMKALLNAEGFLRAGLQHDSAKTIAELYENLKKLM